MMDTPKDHIGNLERFFASVTKPVLFLHDEPSVKALEPFVKTLKEKGAVLIPTSPDAMFALDARKIPYVIAETYYPPDEYVEFFAKWDGRIRQFANEVDALISRSLPEVGEAGLTPGIFNWYPFVRVIHPLLDAYFKIKKIIAKEHPDGIAFFSQDGAVPASLGLEGWLLWGPRENMFKKVAQGHDFGVPVSSFNLPATTPKEEVAKDWKLKKMIQQHPRLGHLAKLAKKSPVSALKNLAAPFSGARPLLLLNNGYEWDASQKALAGEGYYIWGQVNDILGQWQGGNAKIHHTVDALQGHLEEEGLNIFPFIKGKVEVFLTVVVPACLVAHGKALSLMKKKGIKALLYAVNPTALSKSIAQAARSLGIPVVGWQHGDMNYRTIPAIVYNDVSSSDMFLGWGEGAAGNLRQEARKIGFGEGILAAGSATLDIATSKPMVHPASPRIVYATTMYYLANTYCFSGVPWSDARICQTQKEVISALAGLGAKKVVKLHPNPFYALPSLEDFIRSFAGQDFEVFRSADLAHLFTTATLIIVDMPSTTLLQAVATDKPVFCIDSHLDLLPEARALASKRVVFAKNPAELAGAVRAFLQKGVYPADPGNKEFLESFGTGGGSAEKAARALAAMDHE